MEYSRKFSFNYNNSFFVIVKFSLNYFNKIFKYFNKLKKLNNSFYFSYFYKKGKKKRKGILKIKRKYKIKLKNKKKTKNVFRTFFFFQDKQLH